MLTDRNGAIIAAGSTISEAVPPDAGAFGRVPQANKEGDAAATRRKQREKKAQTLESRVEGSELRVDAKEQDRGAI